MFLVILIQDIQWKEMIFIIILLLVPYNLKDAWIQNVMDGEIPLKGESHIVDDLG